MIMHVHDVRCVDMSVHVDMRRVVSNHCNSNLALISLESIEQRAVLMPSFERFSLKFLDKTLQEGPQDSSLGIAPLTSTLMFT